MSLNLTAYLFVPTDNQPTKFPFFVCLNLTRYFLPLTKLKEFFPYTNHLFCLNLTEYFVFAQTYN